MTGFVLRLLISIAGLWLAAQTSPGIAFESGASLLLAAFLLGIVNAVVRPIAVILTLPFTLLSFGLFLLVVNGCMLEIVAWLMPGFELRSFGSAVWGALVLTITGWAASWWIGPHGRFEVMLVERGDRIA